MKNTSSPNRFMGSVDALVSAVYVCFGASPALAHVGNWSYEQITALFGSLVIASLFGVTSAAMFMGRRSMWVLQYIAVFALVLPWILVFGLRDGDLQ
jgi:hypothetical protein